MIPSVRWIPGNSDTAALIVAVNANFNFIESRLDNDAAIVYVNPRTVSTASPPLSDQATLTQSIPNPSHGQAVIQFALPRGSRVSLRLYDVAGREVRRLVDGFIDAGVHRVAWDARESTGSPAAAGIYFYDLRVNGQRLVRKAVLLR